MKYPFAFDPFLPEFKMKKRKSKGRNLKKKKKMTTENNIRELDIIKKNKIM